MSETNGRTSPVDFWNLTAIRVHGMPEGWKWCSLDAHNKPEDFVEVQGAIPTGTKTRGPYKGWPKWPKELTTLWMRRRDVLETERLWELETGKCSRCSGSGKTVASAGRDGTTYRNCSRCTGSGKRPEGTNQ